MNKLLQKPQIAQPKKAQPSAFARLVQIVSFSLSAVIIILSLLSFHASDNSLIFETTEITKTANWLSWPGAYLSSFLLYFFGVSSWIIPAILLYCLRLKLFNLVWKREIDRLAGLIFFLFLSTATMHYYSIEAYKGISAGGWFGGIVLSLLEIFFAEPHMELFLFTLMWATWLVIARFSFIVYLYPIADFFHRLPISTITTRFNQSITQLFAESREIDSDEKKEINNNPDQIVAALKQEFSEPELLEAEEKPVVYTQKAIDSREETLVPALIDGDEYQATPAGRYQLPPATLFQLVKEQATDTLSQSESEQRALTLEHKLDRFGIKGKVVSITQGPVVTLFEYQPSIDTKISTILAREDDLALALQALSLRIIAPIPGRSVIGFEVAHNKRRAVLFGTILRGSIFSSFNGLLPLILGKDTLGHDMVIDLSTMPHLLVAGSTGSGKSVGLHAMIMSLLCSRTPDEIKFILIDPKRLEFAAYADISHLLFPIVTDPRRAVLVLKWAVETMEQRYIQMAQAGVRNAAELNSRLQPGDENYLPLIVIIIDELADLMMTAGKDVEHLIARLAQMARAAGIHLIAATQRPSVDVITGLIKVNFPSRVAYKVTSKVDSRTIIDMIGAEKLLGKGDMLFLDTRGAVVRVHGAYVTDSEISSVVQHIKLQRPAAYKELVTLRQEPQDEQNDDLFQDIVEYLKNKDEISISLIQRVFRIGYNRSARLIDQLESYGYILPADGSKMRKVSKEQ